MPAPPAAAILPAPPRVPGPPGVLVGCDVQGVEAVAAALHAFAGRYLDRVYTRAEQADCGGAAASLAGRFAAKEAVLKLLGDARGIDPRTVEVLASDLGRPEVRLHAEAAALAASTGVEAIDVSISHDAGVALAVAVAVQPVQPVLSSAPPTTPCGDLP